HATSSVPALRLPCMWGRATLATEVSMISMMVGSMTERVMSHLLTVFLVSSAIGCFMAEDFPQSRRWPAESPCATWRCHASAGFLDRLGLAKTSQPVG